MTNVTCADILADGELITPEVLKNYTNSLPQCLHIPLFKVTPIKQDASFCGLVKPGKKLYQRSLTGAVFSN